MTLLINNKDLDVAIDLSEGVQSDGPYTSVIIHTPIPSPKRSLDKLTKALKELGLELSVYPDSTLRIYINDRHNLETIVDKYTKILQLFASGNSELIHR